MVLDVTGSVLSTTGMVLEATGGSQGLPAAWWSEWLQEGSLGCLGTEGVV